MSEPFLGEIRMVGFTFAPRGWALCDGQLLPINQNQALFALLGTMYGGDGRTTFALPDLRGRTPMHAGGTFIQGQAGGTETHTLTPAQIAGHAHTMPVSSTGGTDSPAGAAPGESTLPAYGALEVPVEMGHRAAPEGGGQAHNNMQPWAAVHFCIALQGIFPSRN